MDNHRYLIVQNIDQTSPQYYLLDTDSYNYVFGDGRDTYSNFLGWLSSLEYAPASYPSSHNAFAVAYHQDWRIIDELCLTMDEVEAA